ncbi:O-antigen ligase family protein [Panacibacter ginsenosidivorans]|uniref:O-antigen ligase family protein n=1 Tax=Panacibacter ginsenosidivorans TaxID=1813871 RepID=A0A5B8VF01_9BACT|nr:O-antigen ligase family protein [Panacibacter ginsenosidivorans]QEC69591.1 O-antigen ligase family protein [Panacibacter ginsenosidivorans]
MAMNLKLKDAWYWIANFAILGTCSLSMYLDDPLPLLAVAVPLIMLDRAYVVPVLLFIACIEGSFASEDSSSKAETYAIAFIMPFFLYDYIKHNKTKIPYALSLLYIVFGFFIIWGMIIWSTHPEIKKYITSLLFTRVGVFIYIKMFMKVVKLVFFFLYLKVLINNDKDLLYRALNLMKDMAPYLIGCVLLDMLLFGVETEKFDTLHFGEAHHGDFSANMNALGAFLYIGIFESKTSMFKRFVHVCGLGMLLFVIMNLASRNGLLSFIILGGLGGMLALWNMRWGAKVIIVTITIALAGICAYLFKDSPTVERFIYQTEEEDGGDRWLYWRGGLMALQKDPVFGLGGDETSALFAVGTYSPEVEDHVMHNTFLEFAVEYGIVGEIFFLIFVGTILYHSYKNYMFAAKYNEIILGVPSISYFISIFAGLFVSRVWESTLWYNMTIVFAIYIIFRKPVEDALKKRRRYILHGLGDPMLDPSLALHPAK